MTTKTMTKQQFHQTWKRVLREVAKQLGLPRGTFEIRSNKGGDGILGEVVLHGESIYIQVGGSCCTADRPDLYYRSVEGRRDYTGGPNRWDVTAEMLRVNPDEGVERFKREMPLKGAA